MSENRFDADSPVPPEAFHTEPPRRGPRDGRTEREVLDERATELVEGGIGLARIAIGGALRTARWYASTSFGIAERVVGALASGESVTQAANEAAAGARDAVLELAGVDRGDLEEHQDRSTRRRGDDRLDEAELRRRGAELLRRSADVSYEEDTHPAYARILEELSPDEARILRMLDELGPQPSVDVRTVSPVPNNSQLVEGGLSMIGTLAGCRYEHRVPSYLNNLHRLGLVWFSQEQLPDPDAYQVLEAQPDVLAALERAKRGRTVRRSIHLTPFGRDFVAVCLHVEG